MQQQRSSSQSRIFYGVCLVILALLWTCSGAVPPVQAQDPLNSAEIEAALATQPQVRVVVVLRDAALGTQELRRQQDNLTREVASLDIEVTHQFETLPGVVAEVTAAGWEALQNRPDVAAVALDLPVHSTLGESAQFIGAGDVNFYLDIWGAGVNVAVLDTGIDLNHPDLAPQIVAQRCFSRGNCLPNRTDTSDNAQDENGHGTHVAGIIASQGTFSPAGVASKTRLVPIRVLGANGLGYISDVIAGIDWLVANQAVLNVKIINMSLGGGAYRGECDQADANTMLFAKAVNAARQAGITLFAAAGNDGYTDQLMLPACLSGVLAVGNIYDVPGAGYNWGVCADPVVAEDQVACSSNSSAKLDLLAPGVQIMAAGLGGSTTVKSGTSMSSPHAAAAAALMLEAQPDLTPDQVEATMKSTGVPVRDQRNGVVTARIDAWAAVTGILSAQERTIAGTVLLQGRTNHSRTQVTLASAPCDRGAHEADIELVTGADGRFEVQTTQAQPFQCFKAVKEGFLSAQQSSPPDNLGTITLLGGDINGDQVIDILDLAYIAGRYRTADARADITGDGLVDIFDLVITASNYQERGPIIIDLTPDE